MSLINTLLLALPLTCLTIAFALNFLQRVEAKDRQARKRGLKLAP
jgi:hypothetical protein